MADDFADNDQALLALLARLRAEHYRFITPTPLTHARIWARRQGRPANDLRDVFGWSLPFAKPALAPDLLELLQAAQALTEDNGLYRSTVRVSSIGDDLFLHSAYPTEQENAVFFGPDTYRFTAFARRHLEQIGRGRGGLRVLDVGCGSGAGGIVAARAGSNIRLTLNDINPLALRYAALNVKAAELDADYALGDAFAVCPGEFDVILCNPPYLDDESARAYRHGGGRMGRALGVRIATEALDRLAPGGCLVLYTGVAVVDGIDGFIREVEPALEQAGCVWSYEEIDPDVFGEELERPAYRDADRIAAVGLIATRPAADVAELLVPASQGSP